MSALSELLNSQPVSARQAADRAHARGIRLPYGTIAAYWSGGHGKPSAATLDKLAQVLPTVSIDQLREAAWNATAAELGDYTPPSDARFLDKRQRQAVDELIRSIVATRGADRDADLPATSPATTEDTEDQASEVEKIELARSLAALRPEDLTTEDLQHLSTVLQEAGVEVIAPADRKTPDEDVKAAARRAAAKLQGGVRRSGNQ